MLTRLTAWLTGHPDQPLTPNESRATLALFGVIAFCYNALPPNFFYDGNTPGGEAGSPIKQLFWVLLLLFTLSTRLKGGRPATGMFSAAWPLFVLCLLMLLSAVWSLAPDITLRRATLQCIVISSVMLAITSLQRVDQVFLLIYRVASAVLVFDCFMVLRANGFDEVGLFRGIHPHKNVVGYIGALSIIIGVWVRRSGLLSSSRWNTAYLITWVALLVLSQSKTSLALTLGAPALAIGLWRLSRSLKVGLSVPLLVGSSVAYCIFAVLFIAGVDVAQVVVDWVQSVGFTGRDEIWRFLIARFLERPWLGHGFGGFWDIGPSSPNLLYGTGYVPMINQAHNGYLDLLLSLGVVGVLAYLILLASFFVSLPRTVGANDSVLLLCWCLLMFTLLHNLTETSILRGYAWVWVVQLIVLGVSYRVSIESRGATK